LWTLQRSVEAGKNQDRGLSNLTYTSVNVVVTLTIRCVEIPNISSRNLNLSQRGHYQISQT
jgi:high-affinity nickel permease